ncbi:MAG: M14 family zinc carboxypeptidase [Kofleriaceae bacterium]|nr:M14 family zinc carboxypeptidase [Kofleriaceae bacterium]
MIGAYRVLSEHAARWKELGAVHVATSLEGREVVALELGARDAEDVTVVLAGIHALEWIGVECGAWLVEKLVVTPPRDRRVVVFPLVNVDGFGAVERGLVEGRVRWKRGNARDVDLNRNWPTFWRPASWLARAVPRVWTPGEHARSEPEIDGIVSYLDALVAGGARIRHALSLHSIGRKLVVPYGGRWAAPRDDRSVRAARAVRAELGLGYDVVQSSHWVPGAFAYGMELDHLHDAYGACALLVELSRGSATVREPASLRNPFRWFNPVDPQRELEAVLPALDRYVRGALGG